MVVALIVLFVVAITLLIKKLLAISNKKNSNQLDIENRFDRVEDELNSINEKMNKGK
ncbi:DUF4083 family protein [Peribacillus sp. TH16]|uniref:DUF4083 family protein n=1 Tax=Peribacillus sp. TH16 TaxID=2798482 RepID=UPI0019126A21|nr:DUF4083 family protein [Peribacillus sp. TH16]